MMTCPSQEQRRRIVLKLCAGDSDAVGDEDVGAGSAEGRPRRARPRGLLSAVACA